MIPSGTPMAVAIARPASTRPRLGAMLPVASDVRNRCATGPENHRRCIRATIAGLHDVDPLAKETNQAFGFSALATIRMVSLPSAAPFIATGIRLAAAVAIILDIAAGYITGPINGPGIGAFIAEESTGAGDLTVILAATVWAGLLGLAIDLLLMAAQRRLFSWHHTHLGETE